MLGRWGFRVFDVVNGRPDALAILGTLAGTEPPSARNGILRDGATFRVRGEDLRKWNLARRRFRVCPDCVAADIAAGRGSIPLRTHGRLEWSIDSLRTCALHGSRIREYAPASTIGGIEFARCVEKNLDAIVEHARSPEQRTPSGAERYLAGRLSFCAAVPTPFLDALPVHAAERLMEIVGSVVVDGPAAVRKGLPTEDSHLALAEGFCVPQDGTEGLRGVLGRMIDDALADPEANWGLRPMLGRLHDSFIPREAGAEVEPVREVIAQFAAERMPRFQTGVTVGRQVEHRLLSIRSASEESGWHPVTLRKVLKRFDLIRGDTDDLMDERVVFKRQAFEAAIPPYAETFTANGLARHFGMSRVHARRIIPAYVEPLYGPDERFGLGEFRFAREAADDFMDRLVAGAVGVEAPGEGMVDMNQACKRTCSGVTDVLDLVMSATINWKGRVAGRRDYGALLLDLEEIRDRLRGEDHGGLAAYRAARELGTSPDVVAKLMEIGALPSFEALDPVSRCPVRVTRLADIAAFKERYVSLHALAAERGEHFSRTKQILERSCIGPCFTVYSLGATIYERDRL